MIIGEIPEIERVFRYNVAGTVRDLEPENVPKEETFSTEKSRNRNMKLTHTHKGSRNERSLWGIWEW